jgi:hypothetical protein
MYKTRLGEAKLLQRVLLEHSTARLFYLEQILSMLGDPHKKPEDIKKLWFEKYVDVKDDWNKNLVYWQAQMKVLFKGNLDELLVSDYENRVIIHDVMHLNEDEYIKSKPKTVQGAFADTHATIYHMIFKCQEKENCKEWDDLLKLAEKQINHLKSLHSCFSYRISGELLVDPYGPQREFAMPTQCNLE